MPDLSRNFTVTIQNPSGSFSTESHGQAYSGNGLVVIDATHTPIARIHGAYAQNGIGPAQLAQAVGEHLLASSGIHESRVSDLVVAASVPGVSHTFLPTTVRHLLGLSRVPNPRHLGTLCTGGASAIADAHRFLHFNGEGIAMVIGADDQSLGQIMLDNRFRQILGEVTGRPLPMEFGLDAGAPVKDAIPPEKFLEAVRLFVEERGSLRGFVADPILESFRDPSGAGMMWETAARVAEAFGVSDAEAVQIAMRSHRNYHEALDHGVFDGILTHVPGSGITRDENPRRNVRPDQLARGRTAEGVHSGTSSQMGGGAAGALLASKATAFREALPIRAEIVGYSFSQVPPDVMGVGPISATHGLLQYLGLSMRQMALVEVNEAFAGVPVSFVRFPEFGFDYGRFGAESVFPERINPWGGAIANGHVMGSQFLRGVNLATRFFELNPDKEHALVTLCGGGGQGAAMVLRNPHFLKIPPANRRMLRGLVSFDEVHVSTRRRLLSEMVDRGYLTVGSTAAAVDGVLREASERDTPSPTAADLSYVLEKQRGVSLPPELLLRRALDVAIMRQNRMIGSPPTIGQTIGVVGAGEMGHQLAFDYARAGYRVLLTDMNTDLAEKGRMRIQDVLYDSIGRGLYTAEEAALILSRVVVRGSISEAIHEVQKSGDAFEMIIEAATEDLGKKKKIFEDLRSTGVDARTILATNSSSLTAKAVGADAVVHYFNPVHAMALVDGGFAEGLSQDKRDRIAAIVAHTRKAYYPVERDAPGSLVNPYFVATYFAGDRVDHLTQAIEDIARQRYQKLNPGGEQALDKGEALLMKEIRDHSREHAVALLDALHVEATRGEPQDLQEMLRRPLDLPQIVKEMKGRGAAQGLFRLVDTTGGPAVAVECADKVAGYYGDAYKAPEALRGQLADWIAAGKDEKWTWFPRDMDKHAYASHVERHVATLQRVSLFGDLIRAARKGFHEEFWGRVMGVMGIMHDRGVVPANDPARIDNAVGLGLGWRNTPEAWLRAQKDMEDIRSSVEVYAGSIPEFLKIDSVDTLPALEGVRLSRDLDGRIAKITIDRPRVGNAVDQNVVKGLDRISRQVARDEKVSVVVLSGEGKSFVGGADIKWFHERQVESARLRAVGDERAAKKELAKTYTDFSRLEIDAMHRFGKGKRLTVAVVQGNTIGGGVEMAAQADVVLFLENREGESTKCWMPEASLGIGIGYGAHVNLVKRVGVAHAMRILLTGAAATFGSKEALAMGFADRIVRRDQLKNVLAELTAQWESRGPITQEEFVSQWRGERPAPFAELGTRLAAAEKLWSDPHAVQVMALGQVPPWLQGEERALAQKEVDAIRRGSPEAIAMLKRMVDAGDTFNLKKGLTHIFDTPDARAAIGAFCGGPKSGPFRWPRGREVQAQVDGIVALRRAAMEGASSGTTLRSFPAVTGEDIAGIERLYRQPIQSMPLPNAGAHAMASHAAMAAWMLGEQALMGIEAYHRGTFKWSDIGLNGAHSGFGLALFSGLDHLWTALAFGAPKSTWLARQAMLNMGRVSTGASLGIGIVGAGLAAATIGVGGAYLQGERDVSKLVYTGLAGFACGGAIFVLGNTLGSSIVRTVLVEFAPKVATGVLGTFLAGFGGMALGSLASKGVSGFLLGDHARTPLRHGGPAAYMA